MTDALAYFYDSVLTALDEKYHINEFLCDLQNLFDCVKHIVTFKIRMHWHERNSTKFVSKFSYKSNPSG